MTSFKQPEGQATEVAKPTTSKDVVNVASIELPEQVPEQVSEQAAPQQVAPEQSLSGTLSERQVPRTNQGMPEHSTATTSSTQGGLPDVVARGKWQWGHQPPNRTKSKGRPIRIRWLNLMTMSSKKSKGTHKTGGNMYTSAVNMETITFAMISPSTRRQKEWRE
jgi:hypothetical protein